MELATSTSFARELLVSGDQVHYASDHGHCVSRNAASSAIFTVAGKSNGTLTLERPASCQPVAYPQSPEIASIPPVRKSAPTGTFAFGGARVHL